MQSTCIILRSETILVEKQKKNPQQGFQSLQLKPFQGQQRFLMNCLLYLQKKQMFWHTIVNSKADFLDLCSYSSFCGIAVLL